MIHTRTDKYGSISSFEWYRGNLDWLKNRTIYLTASGSHAYGTSLPTSDLDFRGIAVAPLRYYLGFLHHFEQAEIKGDPDVVIMDLRKFFKLASDCNPNIIELLFTDEDDWVMWDSVWRTISNNGSLFLSQKAKHTFSGYGMSQLNRLKSHRRWLFDQPKGQPTRTQFGLPENESAIQRRQLEVINSRIRKSEDELGGLGVTSDKLAEPEVEKDLIAKALLQLNLAESLMPLVYAERAYAAACREWDAFVTWQKERNAKRSELEKKYGYDTKFGMHLVRLMRMGDEILSQGRVIVKRPDAEELLAIRNGAWSFEKLDEWALTMDRKLHTMPSKLPWEPNRQALDDLLVRVTLDYTYKGN